MVVTKVLLSSVILQQWSLGNFLPLLSASLCGIKIKMGPLPGKFVTVALNFKYCPNGRYEHFQESSFFFYSPSLTYESQHTFPSFDLCFLISSQYGLCVTSYLYPSEMGSSLILNFQALKLDYRLKVPKRVDQL